MERPCWEFLNGSKALAVLQTDVLVLLNEALSINLWVAGSNPARVKAR
jgi:hypothetical protein